MQTHEIGKFNPRAEIEGLVEKHRNWAPSVRARNRRTYINFDTIYFIHQQLAEYEELKDTIRAMSCGGIMVADRKLENDLVFRAQLLDEVAGEHVRNLETALEKAQATIGEMNTLIEEQRNATDKGP